MLNVQNVTKTYVIKNKPINALQNINVSFKSGDFTVVCGHSGCGKSTLVLSLGSMLRPTSGTVSYKGQDIYSISAAKRNTYRKHAVGFIFQRFFLIPYLTAYDNIMLSLPPGYRNAEGRLKAVSLAERLNIENRLEHRPQELSAGEQQRVAMARALVSDPEIILADEPTGNLDPENTKIIADFLIEEADKGRIVILATHDKSLNKMGNSKIDMKEGRICQLVLTGL